MRRRQPPETFFEEGEIAETFGFVVTGRVKLSRRGVPGAEATLDLIEPGNLLCMSRPHECLAYCCHAVADAPNTRVLIVNRRNWLSLMADSVEASRYFVAQLCQRNEVLCARVGELSSGRVEQRLGVLLTRLGRQLGEARSEGLFIPLALSRRDLAELTATTPETVTRVMRRLEKSGILRTTRDGFLVERVGDLESIAQGQER